MIHPARDDNISDEEFAKYLLPYETKMKELAMKYVKSFFAEAIDIGFDMGCIFADSNLKYEFIDAKEYLANVLYEKIDVNDLNNILAKKYKLKITNIDPINIEKTQP